MAGVNGSTFSSQAINTPTQATATTALAANTARIGWQVQNQSVNVLYVLLGTGASTTVYHVALRACTVANDGTGGTFSMLTGTVYNGIVTTAGTTPSYTVIDISA